MKDYSNYYQKKFERQARKARFWSIIMSPFEKRQYNFKGQLYWMIDNFNDVHISLGCKKHISFFGKVESAIFYTVASLSDFESEKQLWQDKTVISILKKKIWFRYLIGKLLMKNRSSLDSFVKCRMDFYYNHKFLRDESHDELLFSEKERNRESFMGEWYRNGLLQDKIQEKYSNSNYYGAQLIYNAFFLCPLRKEEDIMNPLLFLEKGDDQVLYKLHQEIIDVFPNKEGIEHQHKELIKYKGQD